MTTLIPILAISTLVAVVVSFPQRKATTWWQRFVQMMRRPRTLAAVADPPQIENEAGWTLIHSENASEFEEWLGRDQAGLPFADGEEPSLGSHLLIELFDCDKESLEKVHTVGTAMKDAARESKATVVADSFHEFEPWGVSGAVIIQESHYTIHTWPEHGYAAVDLFYCGGTVHVNEAVEVLRDRFKPGRIKFLVVRRGLQGEVQG